MRIAVLGSMKSGKSTFINSIVGFDIMPVKVEACTAKIITIEDKDDVKNFKIHFTDKNSKRSDELTINKNNLRNIIQTWNTDVKISTINIKGNIKGFNNYKNKGITLLDSPGPDNFTDKTHKEVFDNFIYKKEFDFICIIIDITQLFSDAEDNMIKNVIHNIKNTYLIDNLIFILNKIDEIDGNSNLNDLTEKLNDRIRKVYNIQDPTILPVSAYAAKIFKKALGSFKISTKELNDLKRFVPLFEPNDLQVPLEFCHRDFVYKVTECELKKRKKREYVEFPKKYKYFRTNSYEVIISKKPFNSIQLYSCLKNTGIILIEDFINKKFNKVKVKLS